MKLLTLFICLMELWFVPCEQTTLDNARHRHELKRYIKESERLGYFSNGKGVINLTQRLDDKGQVDWVIAVSKMDTYKYRKPNAWTELKGRIVLLYYVTEDSDKKPNYVDLECLEKIIGDRVDKRQPDQKDMVGGGGGNGRHIIFCRDGSIKRFKTV